MKLKPLTIILFGALLTPIHGYAKEPTNEKIIKSVSAYYPNGEQKGALKSVHQFDKKGNLTSVQRYFPNGSLQEEHLFTYDKKGRTTSDHNWNYRRGFNETLHKYEFNGKGQVIASFDFQNGAQVDQKHYLYRKKKPSMLYIHDIHGKLIRKEEFEGDVRSMEPLQLYPMENNHLTQTEFYEP